ncbi:MAG TPA: cytochrome c [Chitinophagaceae bacterium]
MKKVLMVALIVGGIQILASGFVIFFQEEPKPWPVPDKNAKVANPVAMDDESLKTGKAVWAKHCQSCHGKTGKGDGSKAAQLKTAAGDFTKAEVQKQTDGALYYKIVEGRDDMPGFKKKIPDTEDIWAVVHYMRGFKK